MYKIQGSDKRQYGPVTAEILREWIGKGLVNAHTLVQPNGTTEWKAVFQFPEFADALKFAPPPAATAPARPKKAVSIPELPPSRTPSIRPIQIHRPTQPPGKKRSRIAIASLILGILTLPTLGLGGIIGVCLAIAALIKISKSQGQLAGKGLAIAGLCVSGFFLLISPIFLIPAVVQAKAQAQRIACMNNMKELSRAARAWSAAHNSDLSANFLVYSNQLSKPELVVCPADRDRRRADYKNWSIAAKSGSSYEFFSVPRAGAAPQAMLLRCRLHNSVALGDGSIAAGATRPSQMR